MLKTALIIGYWRAVLSLSGGNELPFIMDIHEDGDKTTIEIINAEERIKIDDYRIEGDSIFIRMPLFDSEIRAQLTSKKMTGIYINHNRTTLNQIPFTAEYDNHTRFEFNHRTPAPVLQKKYITQFSKGTPDESKAVAIISQNGKIIRATFLTTTGDYRFLEGVADNDSLKLSCFDGAHAFLFLAKINGDSICGTFYSGIHHSEPFVAYANDTVALPSAYELTYLKKGYSTIDFSFPNEKGITVSNRDQRYKNKVIIITIMGTWCPNCMDEAEYLSSFYTKNKNQGIEIIGLAFEKDTSLTKFIANVQRIRNRFGLEYEILLAGKAAKEEASKALPMLNAVLGYPTTIVIDKKGRARKIHTGFSGPATGKHFIDFKNDFEQLVFNLLKEK
ncbi:MAG: TlpA family protein disulfide reductase [Bacteroidetes bacterium]|nr:TlpA family protein disulfide reductase [Bacteroidota bacterium]